MKIERLYLVKKLVFGIYEINTSFIILVLFAKDVKTTSHETFT